MSTNRGSEAQLKVLREKIADLEACLDGRNYSQRWKAINVELVNARESLRCLEEKNENNIPRAQRSYRKVLG